MFCKNSKQLLNLQSYFERDGIYNFPCVPWLDGFKVIPINLGMLQIVADCHVHCKFFENEETDTDSGIEIYAFAFGVNNLLLLR